MDRTVGETFYVMFTTRAITGIPTLLTGTPVVSAYEDGSITQITAGITLGADHDSVAGLNLLTIVATGANGYEAGKDYNLVITTGTVNSVSAVGEVVGSFSLGLDAAFTRLGVAGAGLTNLGASGNDWLTVDPWGVALPGSYTQGEAGYILGHQVGISSTVTGSGTTLGFIDTARIGDGTNHWVRSEVQFHTGVNAGLKRTAYSFATATGQFFFNF